MKIVFFLLGCLFLTRDHVQVLNYHFTMKSYPYLIHLPEMKGAKMPLLLFLHGSGERGKDMELVRKHHPLTLYKDSQQLPFLMVAPQCPAEQQWDTEVLIQLLDEVEEQYTVDKDRIYITGLSMGGHGTIQLAQRDNKRFAAIVPVCGWGDTSRVDQIRHIPIWAFHGEKDTIVAPAGSMDMIQKLQSLGANARLTIYQGVGHDCWNQAYADPELYRWLLSQKKMTVR